MRNPNRKRRTSSFWPSPELEARAMPWVEIIVRAFLTDVPDAEELGHLVGTSIDTDTWNLFKLLAKDLGTSQENALTYCIKFTLRAKGITNEQTKTELWFLPVSRT
jgi:hypothetical protein